MEEKKIGDVKTPEEVKAEENALPFYKNWRFWVYCFLIVCLGFIGISSLVNGCTLQKITSQEESETSLNGGASSLNFIDERNPSENYYISTYTYYPTTEGTLTFYTGVPMNIGYYQDGTIGTYYSNCTPTVAYDISSLDYTYLRAFPYDRPQYYNLFNGQAFQVFVDGVSVYNQVWTTWSYGGYYNIPLYDLGITSTSYVWVFDSSIVGDSEAYSSGSSEGYSSGYADGYADGEADGESNGYNEGYSSGYASGSSDGYTDGYSSGSSDGYSSGYVDGYSSGYSSGLESALDYSTQYFMQGYELRGVVLPVDWSSEDLFSAIYFGGDNGTVVKPVIFTDGSYFSVTKTYVDTIVGFTVAYHYWDTNTSSSYDNTLIEVTRSGSSGSYVYSSSVTDVDDNWVTMSYLRTLSSSYHEDAGTPFIIYSEDTYLGYLLPLYYQSYTAGYQNGYEIGYSSGYDVGWDASKTYWQSLVNPESLTETLVTVFQQPFNQIWRFLNFNILGLNLLALGCGLVTTFLVIKVIKKLL